MKKLKCLMFASAFCGLMNGASFCMASDAPIEDSPEFSRIARHLIVGKVCVDENNPIESKWEHKAVELKEPKDWKDFEKAFTKSENSDSKLKADLLMRTVTHCILVGLYKKKKDGSFELSEKSVSESGEVKASGFQKMLLNESVIDASFGEEEDDSKKEAFKEWRELAYEYFAPKEENTSTSILSDFDFGYTELELEVKEQNFLNLFTKGNPEKDSFWTSLSSAHDNHEADFNDDVEVINNVFRIKKDSIQTSFYENKLKSLIFDSKNRLLGYRSAGNEKYETLGTSENVKNYTLSDGKGIWIERMDEDSIEETAYTLKLSEKFPKLEVLTAIFKEPRFYSSKMISFQNNETLKDIYDNNKNLKHIALFYPVGVEKPLYIPEVGQTEKYKEIFGESGYAVELPKLATGRNFAQIFYFHLKDRLAS